MHPLYALPIGLIAAAILLAQPAIPALPQAALPLGLLAISSVLAVVAARAGPRA